MDGVEKGRDHRLGPFLTTLLSDLKPYHLLLGSRVALAGPAMSLASCPFCHMRS